MIKSPFSSTQKPGLIETRLNAERVEARDSWASSCQLVLPRIPKGAPIEALYELNRALLIV